MIDEYSFGSITINGKKYTHDVEVRWTGEVLKWWRLEGHFVALEDIERALELNPKIIVIGTGAEGRMQVPPEIKEAIRLRNIELIVDLTEKAVETFNTFCGSYSLFWKASRGYLY